MELAPGQSAQSTKPTFASQANRLRSNKENWIVVERKRKNIVPVTGSGEASVLEGVAKPKRDYWEIAVTRLKEGTTVETIKTHCQNKGFQATEVFVFPSKIKGTVTAKVRVSLEHKELALSGISWPNHIRVSSWTNKSKSVKQNETAKRDEAVQRNAN